MMAPCDEYKPHIDSIQEKVYMNKVVIEFLSDNPYATYEDLLHKLEVQHGVSSAQGVNVYIFLSFCKLRIQRFLSSNHLSWLSLVHV